MNNKQIKAAREALDSMDDYARMESGVDAAGPRGVLVAFIDLAERATPTAAVAAGAIDTPEFMHLLNEFAYESSCNDYDEGKYNDARNGVIAYITAASQKAREEGRKEGYEAGRLYEQEIITQEAEEAAGRAEAEAVARAERGVCKVPPDGWYCTRVAGHDGPCAAYPATPAAAGTAVQMPATNYNGRGDGSEPLWTQEMMQDYGDARAEEARREAEVRANKAEEDLEEWRFTNRIDELEREVNRLREQRTAGGDNVIAAYQKHGEEVESLHRRLAAETLRADQGWERYESANADRNALRAERSSIIEQLSEMKWRAIEAHRQCYRDIQAHPAIETLADEGKLHLLIHAIVGVSTPLCAQVQPAATPAPVSAGPQDERAACPFCGSSNISDGEISTTDLAGETVTQSMCEDCAACGPGAALNAGEVDYGDVKARAAWNRRASLPSAGAPMAQSEFERLAREVAKWSLCMSYNDSYFGEPVGELKRLAKAIDRLPAGAPVSGAEQADLRQTQAETADVQELPALPESIGYALKSRDTYGAPFLGFSFSRMRPIFGNVEVGIFSEDQMRAYVLADRAMRQQAPDWFKLDGDAAVIFGIRYSLGLLEDFGHAMPVDQPFVIKEREQDGALVVMRQQQGDDARDARRWRVATEAIEDLHGNDAAEQFFKTIDACVEKADQGLDAIRTALAAKQAGKDAP